MASKSQKERYHAVFLPFPDVYEEGGPEAFRNLDRREKAGVDASSRKKGLLEHNLVVVPLSFLKELSYLENEHYSVGASSTLDYIKGLKDNKVVDESDVDHTLYRISTGLDLLVLENSQFTDEKLNMSTLKDTISGYADFNEFKLITGDSLNHIKYDGKNGLRVEDPGFLMVNEDIVHEGILMANNADLLARLYQSPSKSLPLEEVMDALGVELFMNQFLRFNAEGRETKETFAVVTGKREWNKDRSRILNVNDKVVKLLSDAEQSMRLKVGDMHFERGVVGVRPRDMEQYLALQYGLLDNNVSLFFLCGKAGSGKTLLTYASAVDSILVYDETMRKQRGHASSSESGFYKKLILLKPPEILGGSRRDPGALPGTLLDKLSDHLRPYSDAHNETTLRSFPFEEMFKHPSYVTKYGPVRAPKVSSLSINGAHLPKVAEAIEVVYSGYIGGASVSDTYIIIDEAQDFSPYEMKTIIERVSERSKIVICGDPKQTRNPKCSVKKNGLTYAIKHFLPKDYSALVYLTKNYRSQASEDAEKLRVYNNS